MELSLWRAEFAVNLKVISLSIYCRYYNLSQDLKGREITIGQLHGEGRLSKL